MARTTTTPVRQHAVRPAFRRSFGTAFAGLLALSISACTNSPTTPTTSQNPAPTAPSAAVGSAQTTGTIGFSATAPKGWTSITVNVDGRTAGTLTAYVSSANPASCLASKGRVALTVSPGSHTYSARSNTGATWSGSVSVVAGQCVETQLTCPNDDCSPVAAPPPPPPPSASGGSQLRFQGSSTFHTSGGSVAISIEKIVNTSSTATSGSLRIELWATQSAYSGGSLSGYRTASIRTSRVSGLSDQLAPNSSFSNITLDLPYTAPASGYSNYTLVLGEYSSTCGSDDHFCVAAYLPMR